MKTPMQELLERVKEYRDSETSPLVISRLNSICVDIIGMLEKEKEEIEIAYYEGFEDRKIDLFQPEVYYNQRFEK